MPLRPFGDYPAVLPDIERRAVHSRCPPGGVASAKQCSLDTRGKPRIPVGIRGFACSFRLHGADSISFGGLLELSYTAQESAIGSNEP